MCAVCVASANYVVNAWLDRKFDKHHPTKSARVSVQVPLNPVVVYSLWAGLAMLGLAAAALSSPAMLMVGVLFALQGVIYNFPPVRSKDRAVLDVLSEAANNPFRLMIGWAMVDATTLPPATIIVAYWFGGAFLMAAKRLSEYREIGGTHGRKVLISYRKSFQGYTETSLLVSCFAYALISMSVFSVFMIKYRVEYLLLVPFLCLLFCVYLVLAMRPASVAQAPERLFQDKSLMATVLAFVLAVLLLTIVDIPQLTQFTEPHFIRLQ